MKPVSPIHYDPSLMEETVFLALGEDREAKKFHRERDRLYGITDAEERERAFQDFHGAWFFRLGLSEQIEKAFGEQPLLSSSVKGCLVARAPGKREEGGELFVNPEEKLSGREQRTVSIFLLPESLLNPSVLLTFLRHELLHITDMLDPGFGYERELPAAEAGPTHVRLLKERYRALWDATIDGRMVRRGWAPESLRAERLCDFRQTFPMFGEETEDLFSRFFDREPHSHAELVAFILDPRALAAVPEAHHPGGRCPLCGFPTYAFEPHPECLSSDVIGQITQDFPRWHPSHGLCGQCAELYRARRLSVAAAMLLPGSLPPD
ncbi:MAG: hypothetical protein HYY45_01085 [Deltaproteobacteria bacterium]|nr:hypothetical protein [Deltaproteobacteria bacterium]